MGKRTRYLVVAMSKSGRRVIPEQEVPLFKSEKDAIRYAVEQLSRKVKEDVVGQIQKVGWVNGRPMIPVVVREFSLSR